MDRLNRLKYTRNSEIAGRSTNNDYDHQTYTLLRRNSNLPEIRRNLVKEITDDSLEIKEAVESLNQVVLNAQKKLNELTGRQDNYAVSFGTTDFTNR